jgi:hypothetical protein
MMIPWAMANEATFENGSILLMGALAVNRVAPLKPDPELQPAGHAGTGVEERLPTLHRPMSLLPAQPISDLNHAP